MNAVRLKNNWRIALASQDSSALLRRGAWALAAITLLAIAAGFSLATRSTLDQRSLNALAVRNANSAAQAASPLALDAFARNWNAKLARGNDSATLTWSASDARDLRASLLALDSAQPRSPRINIQKRDGAYLVSAEVAP